MLGLDKTNEGGKASKGRTSEVLEMEVMNAIVGRAVAQE